MIQLNLLPDLKKEYLKSQKTKAFVMKCSVLTAIASFGITILIALYAFFGQQLQISLISNDIKDKTSKLNSISDVGKYLTVQNQLQALPALHAGKGIYSRLLDILPIINPSSPNNVKLSTLQLAITNNAIALTGTTATFQALNVFVDTLNNAQFSYKQSGSTATTTDKVFTSVVVDTSSLAQVNGKKIVSFSIQTTYNPAVFDSANSDVTASVPNINTTPSVTGAPALFGQSEGK